jgi:hypothetical protein
MIQLLGLYYKQRLNSIRAYRLTGVRKLRLIPKVSSIMDESVKFTLEIYAARSD